jgi:hypothetical protein
MTAVRKNIDDMVRELLPGVKWVAEMLFMYAYHDKDGEFPAGLANKKLSADIRRVKAAQDDVDHCRWPSDLYDDDATTYENALQEARLSVYNATISVAAIAARDTEENGRGGDAEENGGGGDAEENGDPGDLEALHDLGRAVTSAQTGLGARWKELRPVRAYSNAPEGHKQEYRARLVALIELLDDDNAATTRIYDAAEAAGLKRKEARKIVANARMGQFKDPTFEALRKFWKSYLQPLVADGGDVVELLDRRWL